VEKTTEVLLSQVRRQRCQTPTCYTRHSVDKAVTSKTTKLEKTQVTPEATGNDTSGTWPTALGSRKEEAAKVLGAELIVPYRTASEHVRQELGYVPRTVNPGLLAGAAHRKEMVIKQLDLVLDRGQRLSPIGQEELAIVQDRDKMTERRSASEH
jgi:hypothetical protein